MAPCGDGMCDVRWRKMRGHQTFSDLERRRGPEGPLFTRHAISEDLLAHALPIQMPAMKTRTPPTTTWKAAESNGVSM
jgi:hypothetical protein